MSAPQVTTSVHELIQRANDAISKMSAKNEHRQLIYALGQGLYALTNMIEERDITIERLRSSPDERVKDAVIRAGRNYTLVRPDAEEEVADEQEKTIVIADR